MKNFLRALRYAWPYRVRLLLSVFCAMCAAVMWGSNFPAIYPVLKILTDNKNLLEVVEGKLQDTEDKINDFEKKITPLKDELQDLGSKPASSSRDKRQRDLSAKIANLDSNLNPLYYERWLYQVTKKFVAHLPADRFRSLACLIGLIVLSVSIKGFFEFWQESLVGSIVNLALFDLRNRFYRNVIHLDVHNFGEEGTHELMSRFTNDMELLGVGVKTLFGKVVAEPLRALSCIVFACWINWQLTMMFMILVPIAGFILTKTGRVMKRATRHLLERMSNIYKILQETFTGIRVVKAFTMEPYERRRFRNATKEYYRKAMLVVNIDSFAGPVIEILGVAAVAGAFLAGAYLVLHPKETRFLGLVLTTHPLEPESLLSLYLALAAIADPVRKLSSVFTRLQSGAAAADRIFAYMDRVPRVQSNNFNQPLAPHRESIEFEDICFSYDPGRPILTNVHLKLQHGETVALVGKNGCGKTTLVGLIPRFFDPNHGSIRIDGVDIREVNLRSLRRQIGLVTQETILFDDTVYNNIAYGSRRATREAVEEAAQKAYAHDFISHMAQGYNTRIGEAGAKMSGGQKQRIALARAILRNPSILILDECTSQADAESESLIHKALREFMRNRTTLVITHRLNTLEVADRIVVVNQGRIEAVGTHLELLHTCTTYQRLHEAQFQRLVA